jgi:hypothetical protein
MYEVLGSILSTAKKEDKKKKKLKVLTADVKGDTQV